MMMKELLTMTDNLTAVSLFTGAGGMDIGFENAGVKVVFANELMPEAAATYNANHAAVHGNGERLLRRLCRISLRQQDGMRTDAA